MSKRGLFARLFGPNQTLSMVKMRLPKRNLVRQNQGGASACVRKRAFSRLKTEAGCGPSRCGRGNDTICGAMANFFKEPETIRPRVPAAPRARGFTGVRTLLKWRGRREGRMPARHPWAPAQEGCAKSAKTTGEGGDNRPSLRDGFTTYFELSPVNQLVATVIRAMRKAHRRQLGACIGAPGPHDFAVRVCAVRLAPPCRSRVLRRGTAACDCHARRRSPRPSHPTPRS
jgi:hypothetical protein